MYIHHVCHINTTTTSHLVTFLPSFLPSFLPILRLPAFLPFPALPPPTCGQETTYPRRLAAVSSISPQPLRRRMPFMPWYATRYMYIYIYIYIYVYIRIYIHTYIYMHVYIHVKHMYINKYIDICVWVWVYMYDGYLSTHPSIHLSLYRSIDLFTHLSIHLPIYRSMDPSIHPSIDLSIHRSIHLSIYLSTSSLSCVCNVTLSTLLVLFLGQYLPSLFPMLRGAVVPFLRSWKTSGPVVVFSRCGLPSFRPSIFPSVLERHPLRHPSWLS